MGSERYLRPIETRYGGYRYRSRLEARWAVFFDALGIEYDYEPEGYDLGEHGYYLPDFWLPQVGMWAEVKAVAFGDAEKDRCRALAEASGCPCLMLDGLPAERNYWGYTGVAEDDDEYPALMDYVLFEGHRYWLSEGRFFACTGNSQWNVEELPDWGGEEAVRAAREARFEHGEGAP